MRYIAAAVLCAVVLTCTAQAAPAFKHIVIIFQENRTPDNLFGSNPTFEPGVDIATSGLAPHDESIPLTPVLLSGCYDLDHTHRGFTTMYHGGKMDGAQNVLVTFNGTCIPGPNPQYRYVDNSTGTVQPYFDLATQYGFDNRMFQTNQGPSFPAHQFIFGGTSAPTTTSRLFVAENMDAIGGAGCTAPRGQRVLVIDYLGNEADYPPVYPCFDRPTMAELLDGAGLTWKYYINTDNVGSIWTAPAAIKDICGAAEQNGILSCTAPAFLNNVPDQQGQVLTDITNCNLANVTWVIPSAADSDHAEVNTGGGPAWVASVVNALGTQTTCANGDNYWNDTAIFITWDDWGGWYDHVPPFHVGGDTAKHWGDGYTYGFRVPLIVVSAYTPAGFVGNKPHDFGSILRFIESNFNLPKIGPGYYADAFATTIDGFFSLTTPRPYKVIQASPGAAYFLHEPRSSVGPDND
jgi:phospholipase C